MTVIEFVSNRIKQELSESGSRLAMTHSEDELAIEHGVSLRTIRLILSRLEAEGVIDVVNGERERVDLTRLREFLEVREFLEGMAARLVARRGLSTTEKERLHAIAVRIDSYIMDEQQYADEYLFHRTVIELAGNSILLGLFRNLQNQFYHFLGADSPMPPVLPPPSKLKQKHTDLLAALESGEEERAERAFRQHCVNIIKFRITPND